MPVQVPDERTTRDDTVAVPTPRDGFPDERVLRLQVEYGARGSALVRVSGEVDLLGAPRLTELLHSRLRSAIHTLVLDLSEVSFMSVAGAQVLTRATALARCNDTELRIDIGGSRAVERVLLASGLRAELPLGAAG